METKPRPLGADSLLVSISMFREYKININDADISLLVIFVWAAVWASGIIGIKLAVFYLLGFNLSPHYLLGVMVALSGNFFWGVFLGFLIFSSSGIIIRSIGYITVFLTLLLYIISFHYEILFRCLPDISLIYYLSELIHLMPSIKASSPYIILFFESLMGILLFYPGKNFIRLVIPSNSIPKWINGIIMALIGLSLFVSLTLHIFPSLIQNSAMFWASRNPVIWIVQSSFKMSQYSKEKRHLTEMDVWKFQKALGHRIPIGIINMEYPLWSEYNTSLDAKISKESIILIILESVGIEELYMKEEGKPVMPNLVRISRENLFFRNTYASGTKSCQVMPAIFSGIPPQTYRNILWIKPLPKLEGLPHLLEMKGYRTAYFHGSDLSFEQQRSFLKMAGFKYIFDYDPNLEKNASAWGYDDGTMFRKLREWVEIQRHSGSPFFATLFTLSSHHPFVLPKDWKPRFKKNKAPKVKNDSWPSVKNIKDIYEYYIESLHFLDHELNRFYEWYIEEEKHRGTILIIIGDHISFLHNDYFINNQEFMRFSVPLIFAGLPDDVLGEYKKFRYRRATQYDLTSTITGLLGFERLPGDLGLNLFMPSEQWPENRIIYSVGGNNLEKVYLWTADSQLEVDRIKRYLKVINKEMPYNPGIPDRTGKKADINERITNFMDTLFIMDRYLIENNAYTPKESFLVDESVAIPPVKAPIIASHRGNTDGMRSKEKQNKGKAIEYAISAGFHWVEVDVHMTKDFIPVLIHDNAIVDEKGDTIFIENVELRELKKIPGYDDVLTLKQILDNYIEKVNFLIEIKSSSKIFHREYMLARKVGDLIRENTLKNRIIVDSFNDFFARLIKNRCDCQVGLDTPYKKKPSAQLMRSIKFAGLDWIYLHHSIIDKELINKAHDIGLRVMAFTVNDLSILSNWHGNLPDGIITDYVNIKDWLEKDVDQINTMKK